MRDPLIRSRLARALVGSALLLGACIEVPASEIPCAHERERPDPSAFTRIDAYGRFVDETGAPYLPRGINSYPLLDHAGRDHMDHVEAILERSVALGRPLIRTHAFLESDAHPGRTRDTHLLTVESGLRALDRVLDAAARHQVQLVLTLANHWTDYGGATAVMQAIDPSRPSAAFYSDPRAIEAQARYVHAVVSRTNSVNGRRYADDPTIFAWELANEPHCDDPSLCDDGTLVRWARQMADEVRRAGASQPIAWGGIGFLEDHGERFEAIARDGAVAIMTLHVYPRLSRGSSDTAVARGSYAIRTRASLAHRYGRALIVEEAGFHRDDATELDRERAEALRTWSRVARASDVALFPWMIAEPAREDYDGYLIDPDRHPLTAEVIRCE